MSNYRRNFVPGGSYFFTVNLLNRRARLLVEQIDLLRSAVRYTKARYPFIIDAWVVLPEHMHAIWTLPPGDTDYPLRWRMIKTYFSRALPRLELVNASRTRKGERAVWQRRFLEHTLRDERDFRTHLDYVHFNPVKHGWVTRVGDWPHSSFHGWMKAGVYPEDWGGGEQASPGSPMKWPFM